MFYNNITALICTFVALVTAVGYSDPASITGSEPDVTVHNLNSMNEELSTLPPVQEVKETTSSDLGAMLDAGDGAVVTLVAGDTRLVVHRALLVARSPVFADMLDDSSSVVSVPDVEGPVLRQLLAFLYTLQAPQLLSMAPQLLAAADRYGVPALRVACEQQVAAQLSVENAAATAVLAVRHSWASLRQAAVAFIRDHLLHVMATQGWADAVRSQPEDLIKVSRLLSDTPAATSVPANGISGTAAPATQPHSDRGRTPASPAAATPAALCRTPSADDPTVSALRNLSGEENNKRLIEAAKEGAVEELQLLLAAGADTGATSVTLGGWDYYTPLHWASWGGHVDVVRCLLAAGAEVSVRTNSTEKTALHLAAWRGHAAVVRTLLAASADPNARDGHQWTPLHEAAYSGHADVAAALLGAGANKHARDSSGEIGKTPLELARMMNRQQLIDMLI